MLRSAIRLAPLVLLALSPAGPASAAPPGAPATLQGILRGAQVPMDAYFQWKPNEVRAGILGVMEGVTREVENVVVELGADRTVFTAAQRLGYEAYRIRHEVERGELQTAEVKGEIVAVRLKLKDLVYLCAAKQIGRTALFLRAQPCEKKNEAAFTKLLTGTLSRVKPPPDDVDGWIPPEVKATWTKKPEGDLLLVEDGTVEGAGRDAILKAVKDAGAVVKQALGGGWSTPFPPIVRITGSRDLFNHISGRRDLADVDAVHLPQLGELLVCPRKREEPDVATISAAAARQALHHVLGAAGGEPLETGLARRAQALAEGAAPGALLPRDEARAIERVKAKEAHTWMRILKAPSVVRLFANPDTERAIDAELSAIWLPLSPGPLSKTSLAAWVTAFKKAGHADAASEAGYGAVDAAKTDAEFWAWWEPRADPPKKPKPGEKPAPAKPPAPPTKPQK
jgi:hypothetical protein